MGLHARLALVVVTAMSLAVPAPAMATSPLAITLASSAATPFMDQTVTFTAATVPAVTGIAITFAGASGTFLKTSTTDASGVATVTLRGKDDNLVWTTYQFTASFAGDGSYDAATSNTVEVSLTRHPTAVTMTFGSPWTDGVVNPIDPLLLHGRVNVATCDGTFEFSELKDGYWAGVGSGPAHLIDNGNGTSSCGYDAWLGQQALGTHTYKAYYGNSWINEWSETGPVEVPVTLIVTTTALATSLNPVEVNATVTLTATVSTTKGIGFIDGGVITFYDGASELGSVPLVTDGGPAGRIQVAFGASGDHALTASWSGSSTAAGSTSPPLVQVVSANVVHATGVGLSTSLFYPVVDGYRDTVSIRGNLQETASVSITITNASTGALVRRLSVPLGGPGGYAVAWNGRTAAGTLVAAGTYRVTQVVTDGASARMTVASNVTVSHKRLYWYSATRALYGNQYAAKGADGGTVSSTSSYYHGMRLLLPLGTPGRWAALGYQFTLPTATSYSSIAFWVLGSGTHTATIGLQDSRLGTWSAGALWNVDAFGPTASVPKAYTWTKVTGNSTYNRIGRTVRGLVLADNWSSGRYDVAKVKLTYRYALLK